MPREKRDSAETTARLLQAMEKKDRLLSLASRLAKVGAWSFDVKNEEREFFR